MVEASREFVCIRPQTYESVKEAELLTWVFSDRDGTLRNTSFGILSSDGKRKLSRTGRSPSMVYGDAETFERALIEIADEEKTSTKKAIQSLPVLADLRLALDVATADLRPLVVLYAAKSADRKQLRKELESLAWSAEYRGRLRYVVLESEAGLEGFEAMNLEPGVSVVQAESYGRGGQVLAHAAPNAKAATLAQTLAKGLSTFDAKAKNVRRHLRDGQREGIEWESAIPASDSGRR